MVLLCLKCETCAKNIFGQISLSLSRLASIWRSYNFTHLFLSCFLAFGILGFGYADTKSSGDPYKVGIKKPKTGGFVGGEFGFGSAYSYAGMSIYSTRDLANGNNTNPQYQGSVSNWNDHTAIPLNVFGGYQWYFYDRPWFHFGVRVRGHIGYSNYNTEITDYTYYSHTNATFDISSHAIQYGAEAQFLWDFLNMGEHTLGWHLTPIGLEGSTFFDKISVNVSGGAVGTITHDLNISTQFSYMWNTGLHYYFNAKHMVFATYKYRGYSAKNKTSGKGLNHINYYNYSNSQFMLGYAYKF